MTRIPPSVNFHFWKPCNYRCTFCFATFHDTPELQAVQGGLPKDDSLRLISLLANAGAEKLNFVGGEPTQCSYLPELLVHARRLGLVTSLVTNGYRLREVLDAAPGALDWVGLSVDSACESTQSRLGRGRGDHVAKSIDHFRLLHERHVQTKLNTVVTALNWQEDMSAFVTLVKPTRWKIFQVLPVEGQNSGRVEPLLIERHQFDAFVSRHYDLRQQGVVVVPETNDDMTASYAMIDPLGRFFSNAGGQHTYSEPILDVGVEPAFASIAFDRHRFEVRGGTYDWGTPVTLTVRTM